MVLPLLSSEDGGGGGGMGGLGGYAVIASFGQLVAQYVAWLVDCFE